MKIFKRIFRLIYINYILLRNLVPIYWLGNPKIARAIRIRKTFEDLGPIFVKFGQLLSTRVDLLPDDIAAELIKLQDNVPSFCGQQAKSMVEKALGKPTEELFATFDISPLASASIAQVHAATLKDGTEVVVKILRPNIHKQVTKDIELLEFIADVIYKFWKTARRLRPQEIVQEIKKTIYNELDLMFEASNASQLRRNFYNSELLYVPEVYWEFTKKNILVLERIYGTPISKVVKSSTNVNLKLLAERGVEIFFTQVFGHCFFHADMHPGNVWADISNPQNPRYLALDFGIIGTLGPEDQRYLAENFLAFFKRDYRRVAELHVESGWVPAHTRVDEFESAIRCVCEPIFEKPLKDISFGKTLIRLFQTARKFDMYIQPQLLLLQKTLISIEGLGRQLYPDLDLWNTAKPFLESWMRKRVGLKSILRKVKKQAPFWLEQLPHIPDLVYKKILNNQPNGSSSANSQFLSHPESHLATSQKYPKDIQKNKNKLFGFSLGLCSALFVVFFGLKLHPSMLQYLQEYNSVLISALGGVTVLLLVMYNFLKS